MGQHQPDGKAERLLHKTGPLLYAELVEAGDGDRGNFLVMYLVPALARAGTLQAHVLRAGRALKGPPIRPRVSWIVGAVVADKTSRVAVELVGAERMHAPDQFRAISGCAHGVSDCRNAGVQRVLVRPDFILVGMPPAEHRHT